MELIHEAEAIGVPAGSLRLDETLEYIFDQVGLDLEAFAQVVIVCEFLANAVQELPIDLLIAPEERCRRFGPNLLNYPRARELE